MDKFLVILVLLTLALTACVPVSLPTVTVTPPPTVTVTATATPTVTMKPPATVTVVPPAITITSPPPPPGGLPVIVLFDASPNLIIRGQAVILRWNVDRAATVQIDEGIGVVPNSGSREVRPLSDKVFTLTAGNAAGTVNRSQRVEVRP